MGKCLPGNQGGSPSISNVATKTSAQLFLEMLSLPWRLILFRLCHFFRLILTKEKFAARSESKTRGNDIIWSQKLLKTAKKVSREIVSVGVTLSSQGALNSKENRPEQAKNDKIECYACKPIKSFQNDIWASSHKTKVGRQQNTGLQNIDKKKRKVEIKFRSIP